jgi:hypothetical protein
MDTSFTNLRLFFHEGSNINTLFTNSHEMLYDGRLKLFAEASELFMHDMFRLTVVVRETAPRTASFRGPERWKVDGAKSVLQRE